MIVLKLKHIQLAQHNLHFRCFSLTYDPWTINTADIMVALQMNMLSFFSFFLSLQCIKAALGTFCESAFNKE